MRHSVSRRLSRGALTAVGALLAAGIHTVQAADPVSLTGRIFTDVYVPVRDTAGKDFRQLTGAVWLGAQPKLAERSSASFLLEAVATESQVTWALREGYALYEHQGFEFRVGRQIVPWGKSDAVNPTDVLSAKDYTRFNPDDEVRRTGANLVHLMLTPDAGKSPLTVTGVWVPKPARSQLLIASGSLPAGTSLPASPTHPAVGIGDSEWALKAAYVEQSWDVELLGFRGWSKMPELALSGAALSQTFRRQSAAGANASVTWGDYVLRLETAYRITENPDGLDPLLQPSHWDSVLGVERSFLDDFRVQLQLLYRYHPSWKAPEDVYSALDPRLGVAKANALILNYQFRSKPGYTLRVAYAKESSGWEAEVFSMGNFVGGDYLVRPKVTYAWTDALKTTLGADLYGGDADRPLGALKAFNSMFLEAKYSY